MNKLFALLLISANLYCTERSPSPKGGEPERCTSPKQESLRLIMKAAKANNVPLLKRRIIEADGKGHIKAAHAGALELRMITDSDDLD